MNLQIRKVRQPVEIFLAGKPSIRGHVFLSSYSPIHQDPERVVEFLEGEDSFFPLEESGAIRLIHKSAIVKVVVDSAFELEIVRSYEEGAVIYRKVEVAMTDGGQLLGAMIIDKHEDHDRTLDELNRSHNFLRVEVGAKTYLLGMNFVALVSEIVS